MADFITLVPIGGLCNRINSILCALATHGQLGYNFNVYWHNNSELRADFLDLFQPIYMPGIMISPLKEKILLPGGRLSPIMDFVRKLEFDHCYHGSKISNDDFKKYTHGKVYIQASNRFSPYSLDEIDTYFKPIDSIQQQIDDITATFKNTVGIHIRRTDNIRAVEESNDAKFFARIDQILEADSDSTFFLATDDPQVKENYRLRYGTKVITNDFDLSRTTLEGMKNAVIDLWCLGACKYILGSAASTYSSCAAKIYGKQLYIMR